MLKFDINLLFTVINVLILLFVVWSFLLKPVHRILDQRREEVEKEYLDAQQAKEQAESAKAEYDKALEGVSEERARLMAQAQEKAGKEYTQILAGAREEAETIISNARSNGEEEKRRRIQMANEEITNLVAEGTAKLVTGSDSAENDLALFDRFLEKAKAERDEEQA